MKNRIEIEEVENGYTVCVYKKDEEKEDDYGYVEPTKLVATNDVEVLKIVKDNL